MRRIAHISDLHFGRVDPNAVIALGQELIAQTPDLVVVSGDLTQRARSRQFLDARAFLDSLKLPILVVPGNHDVPWHNPVQRFLGPHGRFRKMIGKDLSPVLSDPEMTVAGITTSRALVPHWNWANGRISTHRARMVATLLAAEPAEKLRVVVTHHPLAFAPNPTGGASLDGTLPTFNTAGALRELGAARVDLMLSGHMHVSRAACLAFPGPKPDRTRWTAVVVQAASAISTRLRGEPNAYNMIETSANGLDVHIRAWTVGAHDFTTVATHRFARIDGTWAASQPPTGQS
ncbi:metallophosphoesterase [Rhodospirillum rubrum]|uniref:metallophosphoesterase family protein n=1 Tax=Rhodospirillum rubrum TaxID=1085 RepID=UPI0019046014|nr:metallophosphoesterase [Rhodospirillum rubrum]MBK1666206.1 metallophosphoesterase [Rhodospirillum rubrum]MBK1678189.1 metallophosphoesterase [Rhodospirillum rubrum]